MKVRQWRKDQLARHILTRHPVDLGHTWSFTDLFEHVTMDQLYVMHADQHGGEAQGELVVYMPDHVGHDHDHARAS